MKPLNQAERNSAFLSFLLLFFITIGVVVSAVFFSIEVPFRENEQLRRRVSDLKYEKARSDAFADAMRAAMDELRKFDQNDGSAEATKRSVQMKIDRMGALIKDVPNADTSIYALVIRNLDDLNDAKNKLRTLGTPTN